MNSKEPFWTQEELWRRVALARVELGFSVEDVAREARLKPETLERFEREGGTGPALRRVKYALDRLCRRHLSHHGADQK